MDTLPIRDRAILGRDRGYTEVIIEGENRSELMPIWMEIRDFRRVFSSFCILFVELKRDANNVAHLCAKQASGDRRRCLWTNYNLVFLIDT
jgi:hypothetical protein